MKKVIKVTLITLLSIIALIVIAFIVLILVNKLNEERDTDVYQENGVDVLYISRAHGSNIGTGMSIVYNDGVITPTEESFTFKPLKAGNAVIVVNYNYGPEYWFTTLYDITVDENLNINYEQRRVTYLLGYWDDFYGNDIITVEKVENVITLSEKNIEQLAYEFENVYGILNKCDEPDTTDMIKLSIDYSARKEEYYISEDRITYLGVNHDDDSSQWYEFTPDKCCNLDKINELLNDFLTN
ncbi:MAG: hypothetical protein IJZ61_04230 [Oscillospiraceae bacterium]|nr:hypothetical protein [Oscillospiraceae bacterium]